MSLTIQDLPTEPAAWPKWLEQKLVDVHLAELVAELKVLQSPTEEKTPDLADVCGSNLTAVYEQGLAALSSRQIRDLLRHPELLLPLQESVLVQGGDYWSRIPRPGAARSRTAQSWEQVAAACGLGTRLAAKDSAADTLNPRATPLTLATPTKRRRRRILWLTAAVAALLAVLGLWIGQPSGPTWGFDRGGLLAADVSAAAYLNSLADAADDWFKQRPQEAQGVLRRIAEFQHGCDTLIAAPHPQLQSADRTWLVERCAVWKSKLVAHAGELTAGRASPLEARNAADETVRTLQRVLRERAAQVAA